MKSIITSALVILIYAVSFGQTYPIADNQYFSGRLCNLTEERTLRIETYDPVGEPFTFELTEGIGSIDHETGLLTYTPDTSGLFIFRILIQDATESVVIDVHDTLVLNSPPQVFCNDTVIYLCSPEEICFDISAYDPDEDSATIFKLEGVGRFFQKGRNSGYTCFDPADIDSTDYLFIFRAADSCSLAKSNDFKMKTSDFPPCCRDSNLVTVVINQPPEFECPEEIIIDQPAEGEHCFEISATDPEGSDITYNILSGNATIEGNQVCFDTESPGEFTIVIEAVDDCGRVSVCEIQLKIKTPQQYSLFFDIKPTSCPNPLNIKDYLKNYLLEDKKGFLDKTGSGSDPLDRKDKTKDAVLPAALLGTDDFDVRDIDPLSLKLAGIPPIRWDYEDVTAPVEKVEDSCECTEDGPDGYEDLTLKFDKYEIINRLGELENGQIIILTITGTLYDGIEFEAYDCMIVRAPKTDSDDSNSDGISGSDETYIELIGNHPNPFNPTTQISFRMNVAGHVKVEIINVTGQIVNTLVDGYRNSGIHTVTWDADDCASGVYFYRLTTDDFVNTKKMILMK